MGIVSIKRKLRRAITDKIYRLANREKERARVVAYDKLHPERRRARMKKHRDANKEKIKIQRAVYLSNNQEKVSEYQRQYNLKNKEKVRQWGAKYRRENVEKVRTNWSRRRARVRGAQIGNTSVIEKWERSYRGKKLVTCFWCCEKDIGNKCHTDHIIALAIGGAHSIENLCISCAKCNFRKGSKTVERWNANISQPILI